jgi:hypothetical protein
MVFLMRFTTTVTIRVPSLPVAIAGFLLRVLAVTMVFRCLGVFLSPSQPTGRGALVIEGWVSREQFMNFIALYKKGRYSLLLTTGGPYFLDCARDDIGYAAQVGKLVRDSGLAPGELVVIPVPAVRADRTRAAAAAVARWIETEAVQLTSVDVGSEGPHARRSWLVYRYALEPRGLEIGVISSDPGYDLRQWWVSSEGVKAVSSEFAGWAWETCCSRKEPPRPPEVH